MSKNKQRKGVAYIRYSTAHQNIESAEAQMRAIEKYANENNIHIVHIYQDLGETGTKVTKRLQFQQMIKDSKLGMFDIVLCHKIDRFARNTMDFLNYEQELNKNGVELVAVDQPFGNTPAEKVARTLMISMAQMFSENLSSEVKYKMQEYARKGLYIGGVIPYGYTVNDDKKYIPHPVESLAVKRMYDLYSMGYGFRKIAKTLQEEGVVTRNDIPFHPGVIKRILINPIYKGTYQYNKYTTHTYRKKSKDGGDELISIDNNHDKIVSVELWENVKKKIENVTEEQNGKRKVKGRVYLLTGILQCGVCGACGVGIRGHRTTSYYTCSNHRNALGRCTNHKTIRREYFEPYLLDFIEQNYLTEENIKKYAKAVAKNINNEDIDYEATISELNKQIAKLNKRLKKARTLFLDDELSDSEYKEMKKEITKSIKAYEEELYKYTIASNKVEENDIVNYLMKIKKNFKTQDQSFLKILLHQLISKIVIYEDTIDVYLNVFSPYPDDTGINLDSALPSETAGLPLVTIGNGNVYRLENGIIVSKFTFPQEIFTYKYKQQNNEL